MDAALLASECIDSRIRGGTTGLMCKLDIEKAYDHLNYELLSNARRQRGLIGDGSTG